MNSLYESCCHSDEGAACHSDEGGIPNLAADPTDFEALGTELTLQVWQNKGIPEGSIHKKAVEAYAKQFIEGINAGLDWDTPDLDMLEALTKDVWHFSAAKNYQQLKSLSQALIGEDGKLRLWNDFKRAAFEINDKHINQWLKAEYGLAVSGSQMVGQWQRIVENKDVLPLLEFDAVLDTQTTALCRGFNGTLLPIDHPFWKMYYPPNHFLCRSRVRQRASGVITTNIPSADIPKMFQTNLGQQRLVFPPKHAYYDGLPPQVKDAADSLFKERNG